jgi:hypothetical protein
MEPLRRSLISLAVIALAALAVLAASFLRPPPPPPPGEMVERVFSFPADSVSEVAVRSWQGELVAEKKDGRWNLRELQLGQTRAASGAAGTTGESAPGEGAPRGGEGPDVARSTPSPELVQTTISDLVQAIVKLPQIDRFPRDGQPLPSFGLEKPQASIDLRLADGAEYRLLIGELTLTGAALYARVLPQDDVVQIGNPIFNDLGAAMFRLEARARGSSPSSERGKV